MFAADFRYALRQIGRYPAFTFFVVATLAVGIGSNVTIFGAVNALLLRPLPYADADRLVDLRGRYEGRGDRWSVSLPNARDWREQNRSFSELAWYQTASYSLAGEGEAERLAGVRASPQLFDVLGVQPLLGRAFTSDEAQRGAPAVVIISHGVWQRRLAGHPFVIGHAVTLGGREHTIIGVMPAGFEFPWPGTALWVPLRADDATWTRAQGGLQLVARLRDGVTIEQARADMDAVSQRLAEAYPDVNHSLSAAVRPLRQALHGGDNVSDIVVALLAAVGIVLLIACVNVANLLLARATSREREVAVRAAMGAPRRRLIRQFLTESLVLAALGGVGGVLLALWGTGLIAAAIPAGAPITAEFGVDARVLGFAALVTLATGVLFGIAPALQASRSDLATMFGARFTVTAQRLSRRRDALVVAEVALAALLLVVAALMLRSMVDLLGRDPGFDERSALTMRVALDASYETLDQVIAFERQAVARLLALPGVTSAGAVDFLPMGGTSNFSDVVIEGDAAPRNSGTLNITPGYFEAMGIPLLRGRDFDERDVRTAPGVAVVNRVLAAQLWPGEEPIGRRLMLTYEEAAGGYWRTVVGVVGEVRHGGLDAQPRPEIYVPYAQLPWPPPFMTIVARTAVDPLTLVEPARRAIAGVDANQPVYDVRTLERVVRDSAAAFAARAVTGALTIFGALALLLASIGLYGVISYNVAQRTYEFGVRAALGAERRDVIGLVLKRGLVLVAIGLAVGWIGALALGRVVEGMLFGISATDPLAFLGAAAVLALVALAALLVPALRAARISPTLALRE
jgi:putative ABC transport system permease protein